MLIQIHKNLKLIKNFSSAPGQQCVTSVNNVWDQSGGRTLKLAVSEKWTDEINWVFAYWYKFSKAEICFNKCWVDIAF